jgi:2-amino-4-hydroxy-6-hydroxymethyldihydropteridine diphosphokinase
MMSQVYLGLGTNLGERRKNLRRAVRGVAEFCAITAVSPIYQTPPWGVAEQPPFLNLCLGGETTLAPHPLLAQLKAVEQALGREPTYRWGPRLIDVDLLFYADQIIKSERLRVPHPRLHERAFVLVPLADIAPDLVHPQLGRTAAELKTAVTTADIEQVGELDWQRSDGSGDDG